MFLVLNLYHEEGQYALKPLGGSVWAEPTLIYSFTSKQKSPAASSSSSSAHSASSALDPPPFKLLLSGGGDRLILLLRRRENIKQHAIPGNHIWI